MASMRICDAMLPSVARTFSESLQSTSTIVSGFTIAYGASQLFYMTLSARISKKRIVVLALWACAFAALLAFVASSLAMLVLARVLMGAAAGGIIPLSIASIADRVPFNERQAVLAKLLSYTLLGLIGGAWIGGVVSELFSWRAAFALLCIMFAGLGLGLKHRMGRATTESQNAETSTTLLHNMRSLVTSAWSRAVLLTTFVEGALVFGVMTFVPTLLHVRFSTPMTNAGGSLALFGLGGLLYTRLAHRLLATLGQPKLAATGSTLLALSFATFALLPDARWSVPACFCAGVGFYMLHNTLQTCATQLNALARGVAVSVFVFLFFLGQSVGVTLEGLVIIHDWMTESHAVAAVLILFAGITFSMNLARQLAKR